MDDCVHAVCSESRIFVLIGNDQPPSIPPGSIRDVKELDVPRFVKEIQEPIFLGFIRPPVSWNSSISLEGAPVPKKKSSVGATTACCLPVAIQNCSEKSEETYED